MKYIEIDKFFNYCNKFDLKWIFLPNVKGNLEKLYKGIFAYIDNIKDIEAIIIFGTSIKSPKITYYQRKRFFIFGEDITIKKEIPYEPRDIDILIITNKPYFNKKYIKPKFEKYWDGSDVLTSFVYAGYDLMNRSLEQIKEGLNKGDTISKNALKEGIILAKTKNFNINNFGIINENKRKINILDNDLQLSFEIE